MRRPRAVRPCLDRSAFAGFRFPPEVITVAVSCYLRYGLSYRDMEELLAERGVEIDHVTVYRWVQRFTPLLPTPPAHSGMPRATAGSSTRPTSRSPAGGGTFVQNLRRGHYELATDVPPRLRLATAFTELALAM